MLVNVVALESAHRVSNMNNQSHESKRSLLIVWALTFITTTTIWTPVLCDKDIDRLTSLVELTLLRYQPTLRETGNASEALSLLLTSLRGQQPAQDFSVLFNENNCTQLASRAQLNDTVLCRQGSECLTVEELLSLLPKKVVKVSEALVELCPVLLFQTHQDGCQPPSNTSTSVVPQGKVRPTQAQVWGFGILAVLIISCCSLGGLVVVPFLSSTMYHTLLMVFEGLAVGSLIGSSLFHLMPQAFDLMGQDQEHVYLWKSLIVFFGVYLFYIIDKVMKFITEYKQDKKPTQNMDGPFGRPLTNGCVGDTVVSGDHAVIKNSLEQAHKHHSGHDHGTLRPGDSIAAVAWMIIFGDGIHNFIDGLSIGAAFSESLLSGASISLAVVCEEFPHELGDFAVLLSAGMSMRQAVVYNFLSALTCFLGLGVGILVGDFTQGAPHIFALAAGMFLYISLVAMMGELNEALEAARPQGLSHSLRVFLLQNLGIGVGLALLFVMAKYSSYFDFGSVSMPTPSTAMRTAASALGSEYGDTRSIFHGYGT